MLGVCRALSSQCFLALRRNAVRLKIKAIFDNKMLQTQPDVCRPFFGILRRFSLTIQQPQESSTLPLTPVDLPDCSARPFYDEVKDLEL